jgi:hypothetical protein
MKTAEQRNIAVIYSAVNKPPKNDAIGAFIPEALAFQKCHGVPNENMFGFNWHEKAEKRRKDLIEHIWKCGKDQPLDAIAFFCHGWPSGIQAGFTKKYINELVTAINLVSRDYLEIVFYACLTAENDTIDKWIENIGPATKGGFADTLAMELGKLGISGHVDAHKKAGHTTWVPYVVRFINSGIESRASWLVEPKSESWNKWVKALRKTDMRFRFPFMTELEIKNELHQKMYDELHHTEQYEKVCKRLDKLESLDETDPNYDRDTIHSLRGMARFLEDILDLPRRKVKSK